MRVWIDMTASAHPLVFRPLVERLRADPFAAPERYELNALELGPRDVRAEFGEYQSDLVVERRLETRRNG